MKPVVDQQTFNEIECNRCGGCCEDFYIVPDKARSWFMDGPIGWLMYYYYWDGTDTPVLGPAEDGSDPMLFYGQLTPRQNEHGTWLYSCGHSGRDGQGLATCDIYNRRPQMCRNFPNGKPSDYKDCSYNVEVVDFIPLMELA